MGSGFANHCVWTIGTLRCQWLSMSCMHPFVHKGVHQRGINVIKKSPELYPGAWIFQSSVKLGCSSTEDSLSSALGCHTKKSVFRLELFGMGKAISFLCDAAWRTLGKPLEQGLLSFLAARPDEPCLLLWVSHKILGVTCMSCFWWIRNVFNPFYCLSGWWLF